MKTVAVAILSSLVVVWGADAASHAVDLRAATVSPPALAVGDAVSVTFRDGVDYRLTVDSEFPSFAGAHAFSARLDDGVCAASFVVSGDAFTVEVRDISGNRLWRGCVRGGAAAVETVDLAAHRGGDCIEVETPEPESDEAEAPVPKKSTGLLSAGPGNPFDDTIVAPAPVTVHWEVGVRCPP